MWCDSKGCSCGRSVFEVICSIYCLTQDLLEFGHQALWIYLLPRMFKSFALQHHFGEEYALSEASTYNPMFDE